MMWKRLLLLVVLLMLTAAQAESPFAPYALTVPEGATLTENEGTYTVVRGNTRVVVQVIARIADAAPDQAIFRLMHQFEPQAIFGEDIPLKEGFTGLMARTDDKFREGVDQLTAMVLDAEGTLLILSGYDLDGADMKLTTLMDELLKTLTAWDEGIALAAD